jgi:hypothetical protein
MIDRVPEDGRIVVWKNLSPELFAVIDKEKKIRRIGDPATPAALARRGSAAAASGVSGVSGGRAFLPDGSPLPDGAVVGRIDPATLNDAALVGPAPGARRAASKPSKPRAGDEPFGPDDTLERPDLRPVPEPAPSRN